MKNANKLHHFTKLACFFCGRVSENNFWTSELVTDPSLIRVQIEHLEEVIEKLSGPDSTQFFLSLLDDTETFCPMCQRILLGISSQTDIKELKIRINQQIERLEERLEDRIPGQI